MVVVMRDPSRWHCQGEPYSLKEDRVYLKYALFDAKGDLPQYWMSRRTALGNIHQLTQLSNGELQARTIGPDMWQNSKLDGFFRVPLMPVDPAVSEVVMVLDLPTHDMILERAFLTDKDPGENIDQIRKLLLLAGLCGALAMPLLFNSAFYRVLREPFVLWHAALAVSLLFTVIFSSGLAAYWWNVPVMTLSASNTFLFGLSVATASMFTQSFVEPGKLHPLLRRLLILAAVGSVILSGFHALFPYVARSVQSPLYTAAFAPILVIFVLALLDALRRGSRAAKFQAVGWAPILAVGITRLSTGVFPWLETQDAMPLFYFGCVFEVICTAMGVVDRFMLLKRQRDQARTEAEVLERLAERDPLTGLYNRRAFDVRASDMVRRGFNVMAVLDLDCFKSINDEFGHSAGDVVLKAAAAALEPNVDVAAFRMGGEEFILLLRGAGGVERAERRRKAISRRAEEAAPTITRRITASMGLAELSREHHDLETILDAYARADALLYEAKIAGRDRAVMPAAMQRKGNILPATPVKDGLQLA